ncbi:MAG: hypothetical protein GKR91_08595 [Pseudomonadales bacterium]|nr:hypothetical protein [Pseudomonadales bacterium]
MNWEAIAAVGEILGAIGVIASLLFLSLQLRKSDQTARAQSLQSVIDGQRDRAILPLYQNPNVADIVARGYTDFENMIANDKRIFYVWISDQVFQMQQVMQLYERQLISKVDFDAWLVYLVSLVQTPGGAAAWKHIETTITPTIRDIVNNYIENNPDSPSFVDLNPLWKHDGENDT